MVTTITGPMQHVPDPALLFPHVRILVGMIIGLGLTHLLRNFAGLMVHRARRRVYWPHLVWTLFVFLYLLHFWWWEFRLSYTVTWDIEIYVFISIYALLLYLLCAFALPERTDDDADYRDHFYSRRHWFFGLLALVYAVDMADTWLKGPAYFDALGPEYVIRNVSYIVLSLVAVVTTNPRFHGGFALAALAYQVVWIVRRYEIL